MYQVQTKECEEALMFYETDKYEVVRCAIAMDGGKEELKGCTFRFVDSSQLSQGTSPREHSCVVGSYDVACSTDGSLAFDCLAIENARDVLDARRGYTLLCAA